MDVRDEFVMNGTISTVPIIDASLRTNMIAIILDRTTLLSV